MTDLELQQKIELMLRDTAKGLATRGELRKAIDDAIADSVAQNKAALQTATTEIEQIKKYNDDLQSQIKHLRSNRFAAIKSPDGAYNGVWGSLDTARLAGLFVLASCGHVAAKAALESNGVELKQFCEKNEKAMGEDVGSTGGILVPTELIPNLILLIDKYGIFRQESIEYPMASDSAIAPNLASGLTVYCPGAGVVPTLSDPGFQTVGMNAKKWITLTAIDSELNEDSAIAIGELIGTLIGMAFAKQEDLCGFSGDGSSTYFGHVGITGALLKVSATIANIKSLVVGAGNLYSELTLANFEDVLSIVPDYADDGINLKWYNSRKIYYSVMVRLALAAGGVNANEILTGSVTRQRTFLGYPVRLCSAMPKVEANSQICSILGNLKLGSYLGDRRKITITRSTERYFDSDQIGIRGTERVAPTVHGVGDTTNAGPICGLITAAS